MPQRMQVCDTMARMTRDQVLRMARRATKINIGTAAVVCAYCTVCTFGGKLMHHHFKDTVFYMAMASVSLMGAVHAWDDLQRLRVTDT